MKKAASQQAAFYKSPDMLSYGQSKCDEWSDDLWEWEWQKLFCFRDITKRNKTQKARMKKLRT
jgi:hypothetical protein